MILRETKRAERRKKAFTVIEILVASGIMALLVAIVLGLTGNVLEIFNSASGKLSSNNQSRVVMDYLTQDLQAAVFRDNGDVWMAASADQEPNTTWLRFFTTAVDRDRGEDNNQIHGNINAVSYAVRVLNPINPGNEANEVYGLYRATIDGEETFEEFFGSLDSKGVNQFHNFSNADAVAASFLSANIVEFQVKFGYVDDSTQIPEQKPIPERNEYEFPGTFDGRFLINPDYADVTLTILSDEGAQRLQAKKEGHVTEPREDIIREYGKTFTQRIELVSGSAL